MIRYAGRRALMVAAMVGVIAAVLPGPVAAARPGPPVGPVQSCDTVRQQLSKQAGSGLTSCNEIRPEVGAAATQAVTAETCGTNGNFVFTRRSTCASANGTMFIIQRPSGAIVGWIDYTVTMQVIVNGRNDRWLHSYTLRSTRVSSATVMAGTTVTASPVCGLACTPVSGSLLSGSAMPGNVISGNATFASTFHGINSIWEASSEWTWTFHNPNTTPMDSNPATWRPPAHRCDDTLGSSTSPGCTFPSVIPVHEIGRTRYPMYARHIELALNHHLPGTLTRTTDRALNDLNYATACPPTDAQHPRPDGYSCDEYPFRSTYEGAASQPYGRTFFYFNWNSPNPPFSCSVPWLQRRTSTDSGGYSVCMVPAGENSGGGTDLGLFYYDNRVIDRDRFEVRIV